MATLSGMVEIAMLQGVFQGEHHNQGADPEKPPGPPQVPLSTYVGTSHLFQEREQVQDQDLCKPV